VTEARRVAANARRRVRRAGERASGRARATLGELEVLLGRLERVVAQTRQRVGGDMPDSATRLVSLPDPVGQPIKKGRIGKPVEFGFLAHVLDKAEGIVLDRSVHAGNPPDGPLLAPAIHRIKNLLGRAPGEVAADRGYGAAGVDAALTAAGVGFVAIVGKGRQGAARRAVERGLTVPPAHQVAHRIGRTGFRPQTGLRLEPQPHGRPCRHPNLVRLRRLHPQRAKNQRSDRR
jgi:IS5 family transposase